MIYFAINAAVVVGYLVGHYLTLAWVRDRLYRAGYDVEKVGRVLK